MIRNNTIIRSAATVLAFAALLVACKPASQEAKTPYMDSGREMFARVWNLYRVPEHGLFSEYYPNSYRPDLTYFNDNVKQAQEVSFLWPMSGVFSSAVLLAEIEPEQYRPYLDSMVVAVETYYDDKRLPAGYQAYPVKFGQVDRYYDDNGLVGIDYVDAYMATGNEVYLERAKHVMTFILSGWNPSFDGAVWWVEGTHDQKPACSNGKAMLTALKLYQATGDKYYLVTGQRFYDWMCKYLQDKEQNVVWNSWSVPAAAPHEVLYTYNTGTLIQGAVRLYKATGEQAYLDNARALAEGSWKRFFQYTDDGVPYIADLPWFNLVLFRGYHELFEVDGDRKYVDTMIRSLDHAYANARDNAGLVYYDWTGRIDEKAKPKWLLDEACIPEFLVRTALINGEVKSQKTIL